MALTREKLVRIIAKRITRRSTMDEKSAADLADEIVEAVDDAMELAEGGSGMLPMRYDDPPAGQEIRAVPPSRPAPPPANNASVVHAAKPDPVLDLDNRVIVMPGDSDYTEKIEALPEGERRKIGAIPMSRIGRGGRQVAEQIWWTVPDLIKTLEGGTPKQMKIDVDFANEEGEKKTVNLKMERNIENQEGLGTVRIMYFIRGSNLELGDRNVAKSPKVAMETVTVTQREIDVDGIMQRITGNLQRMYSPSGKHLRPFLADYGMPTTFDERQPHDFNDRNTGTCQGNWSPVGNRMEPYQLSDGRTINVPSPVDVVVAGQVAINRSEFPTRAK